MTIWLCGESHDEVCYQGEKADCPVCHWKEALDAAEDEVKDLKDQITDLQEGAQ